MFLCYVYTYLALASAFLLGWLFAAWLGTRFIFHFMKRWFLDAYEARIDVHTDTRVYASQSGVSELDVLGRHLVALVLLQGCKMLIEVISEK
jgi:hypothetical protein